MNLQCGNVYNVQILQENTENYFVREELENDDSLVVINDENTDEEENFSDANIEDRNSGVHVQNDVITNNEQQENLVGGANNICTVDLESPVMPLPLMEENVDLLNIIKHEGVFI